MQIAREHQGNNIVVGISLSVLSELRSKGETYDIIIADLRTTLARILGTTRQPATKRLHCLTGKWVSECFDLLAPNGLLYLYGLPEIVARISVLYPIDEQRWLVWHYTNKAVPSSKFWQRSHETILCLWKQGEARPRLEVDQIREPYTANFLRSAGRERKDTPSRYGKIGQRTIYNAHKNGALPRDVIKIPALAGGAGPF